MRRPALSHILRRAPLYAVLALLPLPAVLAAQGGGVQFPSQQHDVVHVAAAPDAMHFFAGSTAKRTQLSPDVVVGRMLSFDRNGNGRVETSELGERMHEVVARGDVNADGVLDETEIRTLARRPLTRNTPQIAGFSNTYGFGEDVGFSSRSHIEGAIDDLRLSTLHRQEATKVVTSFMDARDRAAADHLVKELEGLVSAEQLEEVRAAVGQTDVVTDFVVGASPAAKQQFRAAFVLRAGVGAGARPMNPSRTRLLMLQIGQPQDSAAVMPILARHRERQRLTAAERAALLDDLKDVLSVEDLDNFRAAIERRPVVASGGGLARVATVTLPAARSDRPVFAVHESVIVVD